MTNQVNQNGISEVMESGLMVNQPALQPTQMMGSFEEEIEMSTYLDMLLENRWLIIKIAILVSLIGTAFAFFTSPVYEATMMIHVEEDKPNTSKNILGDISSLFDVKAAAISEMELINSRLVISRAVDNLGLYIKAKPKYFPIVGQWIANRHAGLSTPGLLGYGGFVWGSESINVNSFYAPESLQGQAFVITALTNNQFSLTQAKGKINLIGQIGKPLVAASGNEKISLLIDAINANPGAQFSLVYIPKLAAIEAIQSSMTLTEKGKQSGIIGITLEGPEPNMTSNILREIGKEYISQNVTRKLEEAEKSLAFLDKQLPDLKRQLEASEDKYFQFRNSHGTIDLPEEAKLNLQQSMLENTKRLELMQKKEELLVSFTANHPLVVGISKQIQAMTDEINAVGDRIKQLPIMEQELLRLNRDVKVNSELYAALLNTAQQLRLVKAGKVSNVRLIDAPMPPESPSKPNRPKIISLSILLGVMLGIAVVFFKKIFNTGIDNPRKIEQMLGARVVYATIPHSDKQEELSKKMEFRDKKFPVLAKIDPQDIAIESLRSFRITLQFSMSQFKNNIVLLSGPTAGLGKSFVSVNFATVMAASGKRVLLIDADFRNGQLHRYFDLVRTNGLSEVVSGVASLQKNTHRNVAENLDFVSTGTLPANPSEFLSHPNFHALLKSASENYDFVIIDPPPILAVADTLIIGAHAGAVFILTRSGVTTESEINESIKRLNQAGISPKGIVFNDLKPRAREYYRFHYEQKKMIEYQS